jgi:hypothetical protein
LNHQNARVWNLFLNANVFLDECHTVLCLTSRRVCWLLRVMVRRIRAARTQSLSPPRDALSAVIRTDYCSRSQALLQTGSGMRLTLPLPARPAGVDCLTACDAHTTDTTASRWLPLLRCRLRALRISCCRDGNDGRSEATSVPAVTGAQVHHDESISLHTLPVQVARGSIVTVVTSNSCAAPPSESARPAGRITPRQVNGSKSSSGCC